MLSEQEVLQRLFLPASTRPERKDKVSIITRVQSVELPVSNIDVEHLIANVVQHLKDSGIKESDRVVLCCGNCAEYSSTILACWALDVMTVLIDFRTPADDILKVAKKMGAKLLVTSKKRFADFDRTVKMFQDEHVEVLEVSTLEDLKKNPPKSPVDISSIKLDKPTPAFSISTSGTTGTPKVSVHNLKTLLTNLIDLCEISDLKDDMTGVMPLPISHIFGLEVFLAAQIMGVKTVLTELDPVGFVKAVIHHKPQLIAALPQYYGALMKAPDGFVKLKDSVLLLCGGAPLTVSLSDAFEAKFGRTLNNGYGSTECKIVALNKNGPPLSVGSAVKSATIEIVDEKGESLPEGVTGEVRITGPMFMEGYFEQEEETKKVLRNGHYYTGDIGRLEKGNLFVAGRKGDIIIVGGAVVYSGLVEEALRTNKDVREVAILAVPDKEFGQKIKAVIVLNDDKVAAKLDGSDEERSETHRQLEDEFKTYCEQNLKPHMCPSVFEFLGPHETLPKTLAGKTDKKNM